MKSNLFIVLTFLVLVAMMIGGCVTSYVGSDEQGNKITLSEEDYKALPPEAQKAFVKVSGFDQATIEQKINPYTNVATNVITVTSGMLPPPWNTIGMGILALLGIWQKAKNVQIARGSKLAGQAITIAKGLADSTIWDKMKAPIVEGKKVPAILKPITPDKL